MGTGTLDKLLKLLSIDKMGNSNTFVYLNSKDSLMIYRDWEKRVTSNIIILRPINFRLKGCRCHVFFGHVRNEIKMILDSLGLRRKLDLDFNFLLSKTLVFKARWFLPQIMAWQVIWPVWNAYNYFRCDSVIIFWQWSRYSYTLPLRNSILKDWG